MFDTLVLFLSLVISLAIIVPLTGSLVRFRANYNPKGLQLDAEGGAQPYTGPVVSSFVGMIRRVYRIEGYTGLYKGLMPTCIFTVVITLFLIFVVGSPKPRHGTYNSPEVGVLGTLVYSTFKMIISLPTIIITNRAITTPHRLPYFKPMYSLRILLTPTERRKPWVLYFTPGLMTVEIVHIAYIVLGLGTVRRLLLPELSDPGLPKMNGIPTIRLTVFFGLVVCSTAILTPLEVIATRLAIQRNHAASGFNSVSQEVEGDAEETAEYAGAEEDVIGLRSEEDPYLGLVDCAQRIVDEEGYKALYRAWWLTMLGGLVGAIS